jgi:Trypsin
MVLFLGTKPKGAGMKRFIGAAVALSLSAPGALAIVGGAEDAGALSRASLMVLSSNGGVCSAVVVARDVLLTAAHCATGAAEYRVHYRDEGGGEPVLIPPSGRAVHPGYEPKAIATRRRSIDLALVRVPQPLPARFETATLSGAVPEKDAALTVGGYGVAREGDGRSTGTFRVAALRAVAPYGESRILVWAEGTGAIGACQGDSGGPIAVGSAVLAVTTWSTGAKGRGCGGITQGVLLGPQRDWIDRTLAGWSRSAQWN